MLKLRYQYPKAITIASIIFSSRQCSLHASTVEFDPVVLPVVCVL